MKPNAIFFISMSMACVFVRTGSGIEKTTLYGSPFLQKLLYVNHKVIGVLLLL